MFVKIDKIRLIHQSPTNLTYRYISEAQRFASLRIPSRSAFCSCVFARMRTFSSSFINTPICALLKMVSPYSSTNRRQTNASSSGDGSNACSRFDLSETASIRVPDSFSSRTFIPTISLFQPNLFPCARLDHFSTSDQRSKILSGVAGSIMLRTTTATLRPFGGTIPYSTPRSTVGVIGSSATFPPNTSAPAIAPRPMEPGIW